MDALRDGARYAYRYRNFELYDLKDHAFYDVKRVPMFKNVMTIPPHKIVKKGPESHNYSFTKEGEVCFHSNPERFPENLVAQNLAIFYHHLTMKNQLPI
ncbi:hypothetical protein ACT7C3_10005 [Bacillus pacificus]